MDKTRLLIKNLPDIMQLEEFLQANYNALTVKRYGRHRAIATFSTEVEAITALHKLHQTEFSGKILSIEFVRKRLEKCANEKVEVEGKETIVHNELSKIPNIIKMLYSTSEPFQYEIPPASHLQYCYPKINRNILDNISIALLSNSKFYTQVLHLMNRMNLEPPFLPRTKPFEPPTEPCDEQTQTDFDQKCNLLENNESEMESDEDLKLSHINFPVKRKMVDSNSLKKRAKQLLSSHLTFKAMQAQTCRKKHLNELFEISDKCNVGAKISMNITSIKTSETQTILNEGKLSEIENDASSSIIVEQSSVADDLKMNRIPEDQMKDLPIFKNYDRGTPSNKLYIKNLNKSVTEDDLLDIYKRFNQGGPIHIKLMHHGRMKGQAFVTFDIVDDNMGVVEKALDETNGFILKNKPLVVCFGKRTTGKSNVHKEL